MSIIERWRAADRVEEADRILGEWQREHEAAWRARGDDWHNDPNWQAYFSLCCELSTLADDVARATTGTIRRGAIQGIADKYLAG